MIDRILLPLDCSPVDETALELIGELAPRLDAGVILLRVIHAHTRDTLAEEEERAQRCLGQAEDRLHKAGISVRSRTAMGEVATTIIRVAEEEDCGLIAMATHGHHSWERFLLGSVADVLRHRSPVPLLLIGAKKTDSEKRR